MREETRTKIFNNFIANIKAGNVRLIEQYVKVEDVLAESNLDREIVDIAIECIEYVNRMLHYCWGGKEGRNE